MDREIMEEIRNMAQEMCRDIGVGPEDKLTKEQLDRVYNRIGCFVEKNFNGTVEIEKVDERNIVVRHPATMSPTIVLWIMLNGIESLVTKAKLEEMFDMNGFLHSCVDEMFPKEAHNA